jgi:hypothetical protein
MPVPGAVSFPYPAAALRCPNCRLIIGPGRARAEATGEDGEARSRGSAAGVLANAARRAQSEVGSVPEVRAALRHTADVVGCAVERLRMLDYQHQTEREPGLPDLATVLATFSTWKGARSAAAAHVDDADDAAQVA